MTKKYSTKRALIASVIVLALCFTSLIGTTFAWFTDSVTSSGNIIKTGNLNVEMYYADGTKAVPADDSTDWKNANGVAIYQANQLWEPGYTDAKHLKVSNEGSLALKYQLAIIPTGEVSILADVIDVYYIEGGEQVDERTDLNAMTKRGTLKELINTGIAVGNLESQKDFVATIVFKMQENAGNEYQDKSIGDSFTIQLLATQVTAEEDSFGDQYDANAWVEGMKVYTAEDLQAAVSNGGKVVLMNDIELTDSIVIPASSTAAYAMRAAAATEIDLNGKTVTGTVGRDADDNRIHVLVNNGNVVIKNGTVKSAGNDGGSAIYNAEGATLTLENVTALGAPQENNVHPVSKYPSYAINNYGNLTVNDDTVIKSYHGAIATGGNGVSVINDATVEVGMGNSTGITSYAIYAFENGDVTINGGNFAFTKNEVYVNGGNMFCELGSKPIVINGGSFTGGGFSKGDGREYVINGGTFGFNPSDCVADGSVMIENADGTYSVKTKLAKVGNTEYTDIDEAIDAWKNTNNSTMTLLANVTLSDVITLKSTEHHILNLGTYTMTAASGKNAIVIKACGTGDAERTAITIKADATNPGGIDAGNKSVVYYKYADGGISGNDRPIIKIEGGVFTGSTSSYGTAGIYTIGTAARKCATLNISGGTFNCSINGSGKSKLLISGGTFNYYVGSQGDSTALRLISGGTFKTLGFMTADSNNTKFWFGTSMANSNVGLYVDDNGYLVVGGAVITEAGDKFEASSANYSNWSNYLVYSSAKDNGIYYTNVYEALADNNKTTGRVNVYVDELDMTNVSYKGAILISDTLTVTYAEGTEPAWSVASANGKTVNESKTIADGIVTITYTLS